jgi:general secretion pathway protein A
LDAFYNDVSISPEPLFLHWLIQMLKRMHKKFFGTLENPFSSDLDMKYFIPSKSQWEAQLHLRYSVTEGEGFTLITGDKGTGKTITCLNFTERKDQNFRTAFVPFSKRTPSQLLKEIIDQFNIQAKGTSGKALIDAFNIFLMKEKLQGKRVVVFLDDAHKYDKDNLEQLRLLSNLETTGDKLLQIVLIGIPELVDKLKSHDLRPLGQRVSVSYHIKPLDFDEIVEYTQNRLDSKSFNSAIVFEPQAINQIYDYSKGIPQSINALCDRALLLAFKQHQKSISEQIIKKAISELRDKPESFVKGSGSLIPTSRKAIIGYASAIVFIFCVSAVYLFREKPNNVDFEINRIELTAVNSISPIKTENPSEVGNSNNVDLINMASTEKADDQTKNDLENKKVQVGEDENRLGYSIQVGAYLNAENAQNMMKKLTQKGYDARVEVFNDAKLRTWNTVRIGNYPTKEQAEEDLRIFYEKEKIEWVALPHNKF